MPKKKDIDLYKIFSWEEFFSSHHIMKEKQEKQRIYPPPFSNNPILNHQRNNSLETKKTPNLPTLRNNQTSPSHATQETTP